jgi:hypothetical protein
MPHPSPPQSLAGLSGESALLAAVLRQALLDMQSRRWDVRQEAEQFWQDAAAVTLWAEVLDVDAGQLMQAVQQCRREA